jgi:hypothetical protein
MVATGDWFTYGLYHIMNGDVNLNNIKVSLHTNAWTPLRDSHEYREDLTDESEATGYQAGGIELANPVLSVSGSDVILDGDDIELTITGTLTARYAVLYCSIGTAATDILLGYVDFGEDKSVTDGPYNLLWDATGILRQRNGV